MKNIKTKSFIFLLTFFILFSFFLFPAPSFAQEDPTGLGTVCLKRERCDGHDPEGVDPGCNVVQGHRVKLSLESPIYPSSKVYVIECIDASGEDTFESQICTTGSSYTDSGDANGDGLPDDENYKGLFGEDFYTQLGNDLDHILGQDREDGREIGGEYVKWEKGDEYFTGYEFYGLYQHEGNAPVNQSDFYSDESGMIPELEWESFTPADYSRKFYLVYEIPADDGGEQVVVGDDEASTQQQGTIEVTPFEPEASENDQNCISIAWDPYGRIFDSRSLEPIPEAVVELQKKRDNGTFTRVNPADPNDVLNSILINPYITNDDGHFSFIVKDATYKLDLPSNFNKDISIVTDVSKIHPNYTKIYSEIYPAKTGVEIVQQGKIQHRDIPVEVKGEATNNPVKLMEGSYELGKKSGKLYVSGRASHPFTMVKAYSKKNSNSPAGNIRSRLLQTISSDNFGRFSITIDQNSLDRGEYFGEVELEKTDLTTFQLSGNKKVIAVNPILNYIEGYAYDDKGQIIPKAEVSIFFTFSSRPFYKTMADDKGYYRISSINLPSLPYNIKYSLPNGQIIKTTSSKFINDNSQSITNGKINLYEQNNKIKTPSLPLKSISPKNQQSAGIPVNAQSSSKNNLVLIVIIVLVLILGAVAMIGVYLFQKNKQSSF